MGHNWLLHSDTPLPRLSVNSATITSTQGMAASSPVNDRLTQLANTASSSVAVSAIDATAVGISYRPIVPIQVSSKAGVTTSVYALLDSGANKTVVTSRLCKKINLDTWQEFVTLTTLGATTAGYRNAGKLDLQSLHDAEYKLIDVEIFVVDNLPVDPSHIARQKDIKECPLSSIIR